MSLNFIERNMHSFVQYIDCQSFGLSTDPDANMEEKEEYFDKTHSKPVVSKTNQWSSNNP